MQIKKALTYILITPARNEEQYIELTLHSMIAQTLQPLRWVIISDGSTDQTDELVARYAADHPWIELLRMPPRQERHFAGKAHAFNTGYRRIQDMHVDVIGNLDADVSFGSTHFELLINKMAKDKELGVVGAPFCEGNYQYDYRYSNIENVWGGCQLFRRECFEAIGGYLPLKGGCIDHVAVISARMHGWKTRTFTDSICEHHRRMGTALQGGLKAKIQMGRKDYVVGNHPLWELFRVAYQMRRPPLIMGGIALGWGFLRASLERGKSPLPRNLIAFVRREQMQRLRRLFIFSGRIKTTVPTSPHSASIS